MCVRDCGDKGESGERGDRGDRGSLRCVSLSLSLSLFCFVSSTLTAASAGPEREGAADRDAGTDTETGREPETATSTPAEEAGAETACVCGCVCACVCADVIVGCAMRSTAGPSPRPTRGSACVCSLLGCASLFVSLSLSSLFSFSVGLETGLEKGLVVVFDCGLVCDSAKHEGNGDKTVAARALTSAAATSDSVTSQASRVLVLCVGSKSCDFTRASDDR